MVDNLISPLMLSSPDHTSQHVPKPCWLNAGSLCWTDLRVYLLNGASFATPIACTNPLNNASFYDFLNRVKDLAGKVWISIMCNSSKSRINTC